MLAAIAGGAVGPWVTGLLHDYTGNYNAAFWIALALSVVSALAIFIAAPRKVRAGGGADGEMTHNAALPKLVAGEGLEPPTYGL